MTDGVELPLLRFRDGDIDSYFEKPAAILGHISRIDFDCVSITEGPSLTVELYVEDLTPLFGDDEDMTVEVLAEAAEHRDLVRIELTAHRITYDNPKQLERFEALATTDV